MYYRSSQKPYTNFMEKGKEFQDNAITAIDVHQNNNEFVLLGFSHGHIVLLDATDPSKSLKVIKDHHKGVPILSVAFCDYHKPPVKTSKALSKANISFFSGSSN